MKTICVFCGSSVGRKENYKIKARSLGKILALQKITLVYGGGNIGIMREIADSVIENGGEVIGVMPRHIVDKEIAHKHLTRLHVVETMHERKALMASLSDAFIALPGGFGTFDEMFEVLTWNQLEILNKPVGILNIDGYFDHLLAFINHAVAEKFVRQEHQNNLIVEVDEERLLERLAGFEPQKAEKWIDRLKMDLI